jgi:hypothetical protein
MDTIRLIATSELMVYGLVVHTKQAKEKTISICLNAVTGIVIIGICLSTIPLSSQLNQYGVATQCTKGTSRERKLRN